MKLHLPTTKSLNQKGFGHVELLVLVVFVAIFAFVGVRVLTASHADSVFTSTTCQLRGRVWKSNTCTKTCIAGAGSHVVANPYDYCSKALSKISASVCAANGRKWLNSGCARRWQQTSAANAIQCTQQGATYLVQSTVDNCSVKNRYPSGIASCKAGQLYDRIDGCVTPSHISYLSQSQFCQSVNYARRFQDSYTKWFSEEGGICVQAPDNIQPIIRPSVGDPIWCGSGLKYVADDALCTIKIDSFKQDYAAYLKGA